MLTWLNKNKGEIAIFCEIAGFIGLCAALCSWIYERSRVLALVCLLGIALVITGIVVLINRKRQHEIHESKKSPLRLSAQATLSSLPRIITLDDADEPNFGPDDVILEVTVTNTSPSRIVEIKGLFAEHTDGSVSEVASVFENNEPILSMRPLRDHKFEISLDVLESQIKSLFVLHLDGKRCEMTGDAIKLIREEYGARKAEAESNRQRCQGWSQQYGNQGWQRVDW